MSRSIPAGTGKPNRSACRRARIRVDPRGHGEANSIVVPGLLFEGRSPRARGSLHAGDLQGSRMGSIPAGTGKPESLRLSPSSIRVDPRGHGEAVHMSSSVVTPNGRSPRARGSRASSGRGAASGGSIPAGTGKPRSRRRRQAWSGVDPRGHGEALQRQWAAEIIKGRSPRARGSQAPTSFIAWDIGSIPAGTGKPRSSRPPSTPYWVDPRGHGEAGQWSPISDTSRGRSPRARGSRWRVSLGYVSMGSIPAGTGKPAFRRNGPRSPRVDPRGHGEAIFPL